MAETNDEGNDEGKEVVVVDAVIDVDDDGSPMPWSK
jgi:hypothetical protein